MTNANEMEEAILSCAGVTGVRVVVLKSKTNISTKERPKLEGISRFNNFRFERGGIRAWKAYEVGSGTLLTLDRAKGTPSSTCPS